MYWCVLPEIIDPINNIGGAPFKKHWVALAPSTPPLSMPRCIRAIESRFKNCKKHEKYKISNTIYAS